MSLRQELLWHVIFLVFEKKIRNPVFDVRLILRNRVFAFSGIAALIHYSATSATGFFISLYLQYLKGLDARSAGLIMISQPIAMALLSPMAGNFPTKKIPELLHQSAWDLQQPDLFCSVSLMKQLLFI